MSPRRHQAPFVDTLNRWMAGVGFFYKRIIWQNRIPIHRNKINDLNDVHSDGSIAAAHTTTIAAVPQLYAARWNGRALPLAHYPDAHSS